CWCPCSGRCSAERSRFTGRQGPGIATSGTCDGCTPRGGTVAGSDCGSVFMDILIGLFLIVFGIAIAFIGIQVFFTILPIVGFVAGFFSGAIAVESIFGDGFLSTVTGWIVGAVVGIAFAFIAWYWWYAGVLLAAGSAGSLVATGLAR